MPSLKELQAQGVTFAHAYFNDPLCAPSRATVLTGRYAQNSGVTTNSHAQFVAAGDDRRTIATQLKAAGYRTGLVGKYINGYPSPAGAAYVPPGWDYWFAKTGSDSLYWGVTVDDNGRKAATPKTTYSTDLYADEAVAFLADAAARGAPFFLEVTPDAPHVPA